jgi:F-box domain
MVNHKSASKRATQIVRDEEPHAKKQRIEPRIPIHDTVKHYIPADVWSCVLSFLPHKDYNQLAPTCKNLYNTLAQDKHHWQTNGYTIWFTSCTPLECQYKATHLCVIGHFGNQDKDLLQFSQITHLRIQDATVHMVHTASRLPLAHLECEVRENAKEILQVLAHSSAHCAMHVACELDYEVEEFMCKLAAEKNVELKLYRPDNYE